MNAAFLLNTQGAKMYFSLNAPHSGFLWNTQPGWICVNAQKRSFLSFFFFDSLMPHLLTPPLTCNLTGDVMQTMTTSDGGPNAPKNSEQ